MEVAQKSTILKVLFCIYIYSFQFFNIPDFNLAWVMKYIVLHNRDKDSPEYEVISELTRNLNQTQVSFKNTVHQIYTWASVQKRYCNKSYYLSNFTETILLRECFPAYFLQMFLRNALRKLLPLKSNYNKILNDVRGVFRTLSII